jgi:2,4-dienoyl-CoA reductase-like NADH-dependent reductase (Old Yellow Enzyme family)
MVKLFEPGMIGPVPVNNRIIVAPMCQYSGRDGVPNEWHRTHLTSLGQSGAGLLMFEATAVTADGRITEGCLGLYTDEQQETFAEIVKAIRATSDIRLGIQIGHAGRKASSARPWEGGKPLKDGAWETLSPVGTAFSDAGPSTRAMRLDDLETIRSAHESSARRALEIGFDLIEVHFAHGYLLSSFLSPLSNTREDDYGGSMANRLRYPIETLGAVRQVWPADKALSVKFNGTDFADGGLTPEDAPAIANAIAEAGGDLVTLSGGGVVPVPMPPIGPGYQLDAARQIRAAKVDIAVAAVGLIHEPDFAENLLQAGDANFVSVARAFLDNPRWAYAAARALGADIPYPPQYARAAPKVWPPA